MQVVDDNHDSLTLRENSEDSDSNAENWKEVFQRLNGMDGLGWPALNCYYALITESLLYQVKYCNITQN